MSFNWRKANEWRNHPLLTNNWRHAFPGFMIGAGAFAVYVAVHKMTDTPKKAHH